MKKSGQVLKEAREKAKLSQGELASKLGYSSPQIVSNWERSVCGIPTKKASQFCLITGMAPGKMKDLLMADASSNMEKRFSRGSPKKKKKEPALVETSDL